MYEVGEANGQPTTLDDDDIAVIATVDRDLADEAQTRRKGYIKSDPDTEKALQESGSKPVTYRRFMQTVDALLDTNRLALANHRYALRKADACIRELEARLTLLERRLPREE